MSAFPLLDKPYPNKLFRSVLATIRSMGLHLCPRCLIIKKKVPRVGMDSDRKIRDLLRDYANDAAARVEHARRLIFNLGRSIGGDLEILKRGSLIPTRVRQFIFLSAYAHQLTRFRTRTILN